jgi:anti-anti-sigma factor
MSGMEIEQVAGVPVARLHEDLDAANAPSVQRRLVEGLGPDALTLVLDLGDVRYVDSAGVDMLLRLGDRLGRRRARLVLVIPGESRLRRLFALVGLAETISVHAGIDQALAERPAEERSRRRSEGGG